MHFKGAQWTRITFPWRVDPSRIAADGRGGLWVTALGPTGQPFVVHRTASGRWSRTPVSTFVSGLALIPGTTSLWGGGSATTRTGANAVIWAFGTV